MRRHLTSLAVAMLAFSAAGGHSAPTIGGCPVFPANNHWNTPVDTLPVHPFSNSWVATIGTATKLHPDWGTDPADFYGIPYITVAAGEPLVPVCPDKSNPQCAFWDESDDGTATTKSYPIPLSAPVEGGPSSTGDRHVIAVDTSTCTLYELYRAFPQGGFWNAESYVKWNLNSNAQRPTGWTSADAAGLPIFPGLLRWQEAQGPGEIEHAIRFTAAQIWGRDAVANQFKYLWPATHWSGSSTVSTRPPMGARFRLKASYQIPASFDPVTQRILRAFKKYGLILADGGSNWFISGTTDTSWPEAVDTELKSIAGSNFEAVDTSLLMVNVNSGQAALPTPTTSPRLANISTRMRVLTGDNVMIGGFIVSGGAPKDVVVRARGPSLTAAGVPNVLANPQLDLYSGSTVIASNNDWQQAGNANAVQASGFAPSEANESAILTTLGPGPYTAIVSGAAGGTGVGIVEVFEVNAPEAPLINIATRGFVETGSDVMIGGFIIQGNFPKTVVVRARGPSLAAAGVPNTLSNPFLQLFSGATQIAVNDDWQSATFAAQMVANGVAPSSAAESAIMITLNPGAYTAIVSGAGGATGVAIVEVFAQ